MNNGLEDFLRDVIAERVPKFYFDTNVILNILRPERSSGARYSVRLLEIIVENGWECFSSYFALMEALDIEQENMWFRSRIRAGDDVDGLLRRRAQRDRLNPRTVGRIRADFGRFVAERQDLITWVVLDEADWDQALAIAIETNVRAPDCIHAATAMTSGCDLLVTSDTAFRSEMDQIRAAEPRELVSALEQAE